MSERNWAEEFSEVLDSLLYEMRFDLKPFEPLEPHVSPDDNARQYAADGRTLLREYRAATGKSNLRSV